ncbi:uncharacterized protein LOC124606449 [Schistocerca americana]|uniref:uncharacterized protein LOC124606449 n=1 Tax=Schistocerca americana TaxID=7009 RepID=UPI001F502B45|nr:uncharacterized protein LOC124606449 [Schistocerca americana]
MLENLVISVRNSSKSSVQEFSNTSQISSTRPKTKTAELTLKLSNRFSVLENSTEEKEQSNCIIIHTDSSVINAKLRSQSKTNRPTICKQNKKHTLENRHEILILADSHGRGVAEIMSSKKTGFKVTGVIKPGAPLCEVLNSCNQSMTNGRTCVIIGGANDVSHNETRRATTGLKQVICKMPEVKFFVVSIPLRYDLMENSCVNTEIITANRLSAKICRGYPNATYVRINSDCREHFKEHGLHRNMKGKEAMSAEISNAIKDSKVERNPITLSENGLIKVSTLVEIGRADDPQSLVATEDSLTLEDVKTSEVLSSTAATSAKLSVMSKSSKTAEPLSSAADVPPSPAGSKSSPESVTSPSIRRTEARPVVQNATQISSTEEKSTPSKHHLSASYAASTSTVTSVPTVVQDLNENAVSAKVPVSIGTSVTKTDSASKLAASPTSTESSASETPPHSYINKRVPIANLLESNTHVTGRLVNIHIKKEQSL